MPEVPKHARSPLRTNIRLFDMAGSITHSYSTYYYHVLAARTMAFAGPERGLESIVVERVYIAHIDAIYMLACKLYLVHIVHKSLPLNLAPALPQPELTLCALCDPLQPSPHRVHTTRNIALPERLS